jgi:hypothetical protein
MLQQFTGTNAQLDVIFISTRINVSVVKSLLRGSRQGTSAGSRARGVIDTLKSVVKTGEKPALRAD